jgi:hypothetical protein
MPRLLTPTISLLLFCAVAACGRPANSDLSPKDLAKAEHLITQLEQLDNYINTGPDSAQYKARITKLSDGFNETVASLPDGDVKTDAATAVYWFGQLALNLNQHAGAAASETQCTNERPGVYQKLCLSAAGSTRDFLWAKSRLHISWAKAGIAFQKTGNLCSPLDDIAVERKLDQTLAARVIDLLKALETQVIVYQSLGDFETNGKLARVPFSTFKKQLLSVSADAENILAWLPQNTLKSEIGNALHSFQDGAYWWEQIDSPRVVRASDLVPSDYNRSGSEVALLTTVPYTIAVNWRQGCNYLKHAEQMMNS